MDKNKKRALKEEYKNKECTGSFLDLGAPKKRPNLIDSFITFLNGIVKAVTIGDRVLTEIVKSGLILAFCAIELYLIFL